MPLALSSENAAALASGALIKRDFLYIVARDRSSLGPEPYGFWSDIGDISALVINPDTGISISRNFYGAGRLISISDIHRVSSVTVQTIKIRMSQIDPLVEQMVRDSDLKQARVEVFVGLFNRATWALVAPAANRFVGFVDYVEVKTPPENEMGYVDLTCTTHTQEMTRYNPDTRSHESQRLRSSTDNFYQDTTMVGEWLLKWGKAEQTVKTVVKGVFNHGEKP